MMPKHHVENLRCIVYWKIRYSLKGYTPPPWHFWEVAKLRVEKLRKLETAFLTKR